jgi:S1-C subfamily serine protease
MPALDSHRPRGLSRTVRTICCATLVAAVSASPLLARQRSPSGTSVVKVYCTVQRQDPSTPWQSGRLGGGTGSGFIIPGRRILTNAHVASDVRFLQVQKEGDPSRFVAKVDQQLVGHDCDLAILTVDDASFFNNTAPLRFADDLPALNDEVTVIGYPMGGSRLSVTRGVVSRIDYGIYAHSGVDQHLIMQVDAAINPGNSGGPIFFKDRVVGVAFQGLAIGDNIGYGIPLPVIQHYLNDVKDGRYNGYPELGVAYLSTENAALRQDLGITNHNNGIVVHYVDPFGAAKDKLFERDVLLSIEGHTIANDGSVLLEKNRVDFSELIERKQWGECVMLDVWRSNRAERISIPLSNPPDPFVYRNTYDQPPEYVIRAGLVFSPLMRDYLRIRERDLGEANAHQLLYLSRYAKLDKLHKDVDEFVVLIHRLPHPINTYADRFMDGVVSKVNDIRIQRLSDLVTAFNRSTNGFHVIKFSGIPDPLILDASMEKGTAPELLKAYNVPAAEFFRSAP